MVSLGHNELTGFHIEYDPLGEQWKQLNKTNLCLALEDKAGKYTILSPEPLRDCRLLDKYEATI